MDIATISELITSLGFPIVMVLGMGYFIWRAFEKLTAQNEAREEKLYTTIAQAQATNERLTQTNAEFVQVLSTYKDDLDEIKDDISDIKDKMNTRGDI